MSVEKITDYPHNYELKTRWRDIDSFGHVNNAVFLSYIEDARILFFRRWKITEMKKSLIVASIKIDYLQQIDHPSDLIVGQKISRIGNSSFDIQSTLFIKGQSKPVARSVVISVCFDYKKNKSVPVYDEITADFHLHQ